MALLEPNALMFLALMALCTGFIKGGLPAVGPLVSAAVTLWFPPRDALGITVLLFLIGDSAAVYLYWRLANWKELVRMLPPLIIGIAVGWVVLRSLDNHALGLTIGGLVLALVALEPLRPRLSKWALAHPATASITSGWLAGVATTISNSAGPILNIYFLVLNLDKRSFIGTATIFFAIANTVKVGAFAWQGILQPHYFPSLAVMIPLVYLGAWCGRKFFEWIPQLWFNRVVLTLTAVAGVMLVANNLR
ncbi:MAG TPA: sulfite exporter TauE/SafE family protein [Candidatus Acidoferrum sp.]|nr:sulfite exporter TauE/SafE family protein [Candidatus Acidoferrum sp.]